VAGKVALASAMSAPETVARMAVAGRGRQAPRAARAAGGSLEVPARDPHRPGDNTARAGVLLPTGRQERNDRDQHHADETIEPEAPYPAARCIHEIALHCPAAVGSGPATS
jgi:hypothetical protein